ncbi:hypothetical protein [Brasilonema sp. UFV-L1]|uniref:hypothetical protein n=1 Tax=Brasilonema sp. UFV-L1 TaxID=2234130 RepID=UPI001B7D03F2|nr:hypothetical protein [Brasilonema sp. UFV-L1]
MVPKRILYNEVQQNDESDRETAMVIEPLKRETAIHACQELVELVTHHTDDKGNGIHSTAIAQLEFMRESALSKVQRIVRPGLGGRQPLKI